MMCTIQQEYVNKNEKSPDNMEYYLQSPLRNKSRCIRPKYMDLENYLDQYTKLVKEILNIDLRGVVTHVMSMSMCVPPLPSIDLPLSV